MNRGFLLVSLVVLGIPGYLCQNAYETCRQSFQCGDLTDIPYPFYGGDRPVSCGAPGYELTCEGGGGGVPLINTSSITYRVLAMDNRTRTLTVARNDLWSGPPCAQQLTNTTVDPALYDFYATANDQLITLFYGCTSQISSPPLPNQFSCSANGLVNGLAFFFVIPPSVSITCAAPAITVRVNQTAAALLTENLSLDLLQTSLRSGFSIQWSLDNGNCERCVGSGGACGSNSSTGAFACHCVDATFQSTCTNGASNPPGK